MKPSGSGLGVGFPRGAAEESKEEFGVAWATREVRMVLGTTLFLLDGNPYYGPTFSRGGLTALFSCSTCHFSGPGVNLMIVVEHKNAEDINFLPLGAFPAIGVIGITPLTLTGIKEQVRFAYTIAGAAPTDAVHFSMLAPAWRAY